MKVSEDRFPLLFVYLEDQQDHYEVRARSISRGAAHILSRWPHYLTFVSYMSLIGLLSLLVCFVLSVLVLTLLTTSGFHNPRKFSVGKCEIKGGATDLFRLNSIPQLMDAENASFVVGVQSDNVDSKTIACAIESYIKWTTQPVYYIHVVEKEPSSDVRIFEEFEKKYKNYKTVLIPMNSFISGIQFKDSKFLSGRLRNFLVKVLLSWSYGGTVLDADVITLSDFDELISNQTTNGLVMGFYRGDSLLISTRAVCHAFIFDLLKYMTKHNATAKTTPEYITDVVHRRFCSPGRNCTAVQITSDRLFCDPANLREKCLFLKWENSNSTGIQDRVCPSVKYMT